MTKKLEHYLVSMNRPGGVGWREQSSWFLQTMVRIGSEVLKLGGLVSLDKSFDPDYMRDNFKIKLAPEDVIKIRNLENVSQVKKI